MYLADSRMTAINLPLAEAISLPLVEATCTVRLPATFQNVIFQASFVYTMYSHIILYLQLFTTITGWQENMVETESPHFHGMTLLKIKHHIVKAFGCNISESQRHVSSLPAATFFTVRKNIQPVWKRGVSYRGEMPASDTSPTQTALCDFRFQPRCR